MINELMNTKSTDNQVIIVNCRDYCIINQVLVYQVLSTKNKNDNNNQTPLSA